MVIIKSKSEIEKMKEAGRITYETLKEVSKAVKPGVTTMELDMIAEDISVLVDVLVLLRVTADFPAQFAPVLMIL